MHNVPITRTLLSTIYLVVDAKFENFYNGSGGKVMIIGEFHPSNWKPWNLPLPSWPCQIRNENLDAFCLLKVVKNCKNEIIICNSFTKQNQIEKSWIVCDPLWVLSTLVEFPIMVSFFTVNTPLFWDWKFENDVGNST